MSAVLRKSLHERIERLAAFDKIDAPPYVLCTEVLLVFKAAFALYRDQMATVFASWVSTVASAEVAVCPNCAGYLPHELHVCDKCIAKAAAESIQ